MQYIQDPHIVYQSITDRIFKVRGVGGTMLALIFGISTVHAFITRNPVLTGSEYAFSIVKLYVGFATALEIIIFLILRVKGLQKYYKVFITDKYFVIFFISFIAYVYIFDHYLVLIGIYVVFLIFYHVYRAFFEPKANYCFELHERNVKAMMEEKNPVRAKSAVAVKKASNPKRSELMLVQQNLQELKKKVGALDDDLNEELRQVLHKIDAIATNFLISDEDAEEHIRDEYSQVLLKYSAFLAEYDFASSSAQNTEHLLDIIKEVMRRIQSDIYKKTLSDDNINYIENDMRLRRLL